MKEFIVQWFTPARNLRGMHLSHLAVTMIWCGVSSILSFLHVMHEHGVVINTALAEEVAVVMVDGMDDW